ncbi:DUF6446 family protein [Paracoccus fistulariae]|uniref:Histidine kinase n=1 Tax=Paracoccus fistulariae TaxID=658446 RepID=A0ABY7SMH8_9RHOB|nr:DUF6446 family protein [Paracoccus fistulariae]MDB6180118.1 DUF6446 family protein [Paracoccus fistulariae]WCR08204.1 histidine kinase [Paracoccus fistulariae]
MKGKWPVLAILGSAVLVGGGIWYTQQYMYYQRIDPTAPQAAIFVETASGQQELQLGEYQGIDATSAPHRWRACAVVQDLPADAVPFDGPLPSYAPGWFDCFDAEAIGEDLEAGNALAYLSQSEIYPDVDRVIAVYPDGRLFGWNQYNEKTPERGVMD